MKRIFLHIGYPKTGTSAIQTALLASRVSLLEANIFFPDVHAGLCNAVTAKFYPRPGNLFPYCEMPPDECAIQQNVDRDFLDVDAALQASFCSIGVISSESLIALDPENMRRLRDWILTRADAVTIVCYVRSPASYAASVIQECVKYGGRLPLTTSDLPIAKFRYQLPWWEMVFGRENILVRSADRADLTGGDVVTDFAQLIGYDGGLDRSTEYKNEGLSHAAVLLLDSINALDNRLVTSSRMFRKLWNLPGEKYRLPSDFLQSIEVQSQIHVQYLRDVWGINFKKQANDAGLASGFSEATAQGLAEFIAELHRQAPSSEPPPFRERW